MLIVVVELGDGGFMNTDDIQPGMKLVLISKDSTEHHTSVVLNENGKIYIEATVATQNFIDNLDKFKPDVHVIVNNTTYTWQKVNIQNKNGQFILMVDGNPKVMNRRKYPRQKGIYRIHGNGGSAGRLRLCRHRFR